MINNIKTAKIKMPKVILDTNVLINGVQDENSFTYKIIAACITGELQAVCSPKVQKEYKFLARQLVTDEEYLNILDDFYESAQIVNPKNHNDLISADPEDNKLLDAAEEAQAEYIITEDAHLLDVENFDETEIVEPADFWHTYQHGKSEEDESGEDWQDWAKGIGIG